MASENLTVVFFLENYYMEKLLLLNPVINSSPVLAVYSQIKPKYFRRSEWPFALTLETEAVSFEQALPQILDSINSEWMLYLKPEEKMPFIDQQKILKLPYYFLKIHTIGDNTLEQRVETHCYELRLFNKPGLFSPGFQPGDPENSCLDLTVNNYTAGFPELDKLKLKKYIRLYRNGDKRLSVILYLARKNYLAKEILLKEIENLTSEESKSAEALGLYCEIAKMLIERDDFKEAKVVLEKVLKDFDNSPVVNYLLADIYFKTGQFTLAITFLKKCIEMGKNQSYYKFSSFPSGWINYEAYYRLGIIYLELNDFSGSREAFENSLESKHDFIEAKERLDFVENELNENYGKSRELDFVCQSCGNCCRQKFINITHGDLKRILENRPDLKVDDFVRFSVQNAKNADLSLPGGTPFSGEFFTGEDKRKKWMLLKKKPESQDCIFLTENNLCSIHHFKPVVCKTWPFILREADKNIVWAKNNREFIKQYCAHKLIKDGNNAEELEYNLKEFKNDREEYIRLIYKWNRESEIKNSKVSDREFIKFLLDKSADSLKDKRKYILNKILEVLKQDNRIKLIVGSPFASEYFPRIDDDLFLGLYIDNDSIFSFSEKGNMEQLKIKFKAKSVFYSPLPVKTYNFYFEDTFLILYIYPSDYLNEGIYERSNILHNPLETELQRVSGQGILQTELKRIYQSFHFCLKEALKLINKKNYERAYALLVAMVNDFLFSMVCWLNQREFSFLEIHNFKNSSVDLKDFILGLFDYISPQSGAPVSGYRIKFNKKSQIKFAKELADIFERNWQLKGMVIR